MHLRPYQLRAVDALRASWRKVPILVMPTGSGKTQVAASIIEGAVAKNRRALILAHTRQIVLQTAARFRERGLNVGVLMAEHSPGDAPVVVASIQTLARRPPQEFGVVVVDEAHHAAGKTYRAIIARYLDGCVLGLTATPQRLDGLGLGDVGFGVIVEPVTYEELFRDGWLLKPLIYAPEVPDMTGVRRTAGEYVMGEAEKKITGKLVEHFQRLGRAPAVAFGCSIEHSQRIAAAFNAAGVAAEHLDGTDPQETRDATLARLGSGATTLLSVCSLLGEGWDLPALATVVMARPTLSLTVYRQQAGRVMRPAPDKAVPIILDHAGNTLRHGVPWDTIAWSLEGRPRTEGVAPMKRCEECYAIIPIGSTVCPECGAIVLVRSSVPVETSEKLALHESHDSRREWYALRVQEASARRRRIGWARHAYKQRYGVWPRKMDDLEEAYVCCFPEWTVSQRGRRYCARCLRTNHHARDPGSHRLPD